MIAELTFTGTSSALTELNRFHSSFVLQYKDYHLLVDAGDGISKALLTAGIPYNLINGVLLTHRHADHWSGLPSLFTQWKLEGRTAQVSIFAHESDIEPLKQYLHNSYIFDERLGFTAEYIPFKTMSTFTPVHGLTVTPFKNSHLEKYKKNDASDKTEFFSGSFLFSTGGKTVYYTGDIGSESDLLLTDVIQDIYITECSHLSDKAVRELAEKFNSAMIFLTHYSSSREESLISIIDEHHENRITLAREGTAVNLTDGSVCMKGSNIYV